MGALIPRKRGQDHHATDRRPKKKIHHLTIAGKVSQGAEGLRYWYVIVTANIGIEAA